MALEVNSLLKGITIDIGGASSLGELEHFAAFESSLDRFMQTLLVWCSAETVVSVRAAKAFELSPASCPLAKLVDQRGALARALYYSDNDEFELLLSAQQGPQLVARVVMDPVLFYLTPSSSR